MSDKSGRNNLNTVLNSLKQCDFEKAASELNVILMDDLENEAVNYVLHGISFWEKRLEKLENLVEPFEKGEFMISQWRPFLQYMKKYGENDESVLFAFKTAVFTIALDCYAELFADEAVLKEPEPYRKIGICHKALGNFEEAIKCLTFAAGLDKNSAAICAELADAYALCGESKISKVFFREAFFIGADNVDLQYLEAPLICKLVHEVESMGYSDDEVAEWLPVYGKLKGVFNVKRELRPVEFGQLKQKIFLLEREVREKTEFKRKTIIPRLINSYFWLIDHYLDSDDGRSKIDDVLLRIKVLDKDIYAGYVR